MRPANAALTSFLATGTSAIITDLYTIKTTQTGTYRFTGGLEKLTVPSACFADANSLNYGAPQTFLKGPPFGRSKITTKIGVEPAELDIDIYASASDLIGSITFAEAVLVGFFDGATVELDRLWQQTPLDTSLGAMTWFYGVVADVDIGRSAIRMKVKSLLNLLQTRQMPPRVFMSPCPFTFGGVRCGYNRITGVAADGTTGGPAQITITATTTNQILITNATAISTNYVQGTMTGATGQNAGISRTVASGNGGTALGLFKPFPYPVAIGDTFTVLPGCDHSTGTGGCAGRNNLKRYGGFVHIPPPEAAA